MGRMTVGREYRSRPLRPRRISALTPKGARQTPPPIFQTTILPKRPIRATRMSPIYAHSCRADGLYAVEISRRDRSNDSLPQTPTRSTDLCRSGGIIAAPADQTAHSAADYFRLKAISMSSTSLAEIMTSGPMSLAAMIALALYSITSRQSKALSRVGPVTITH